VDDRKGTNGLQSSFCQLQPGGNSNVTRKPIFVVFLRASNDGEQLHPTRIFFPCQVLFSPVVFNNIQALITIDVEISEIIFLPNQTDKRKGLKMP
jgi:hypothetical protein